MRNLNDALKRAEALREFRKVNSLAFERNEDFQDIVILADTYLDFLRGVLNDQLGTIQTSQEE